MKPEKRSPAGATPAGALTINSQPEYTRLSETPQAYSDGRPPRLPPLDPRLPPWTPALEQPPEYLRRMFEAVMHLEDLDDALDQKFPNRSIDLGTPDLNAWHRRMVESRASRKRDRDRYWQERNKLAQSQGALQ